MAFAAVGLVVSRSFTTPVIVTDRMAWQLLEEPRGNDGRLCGGENRVRGWRTGAG